MAEVFSWFVTQIEFTKHSHVTIVKYLFAILVFKRTSGVVTIIHPS